MSRNSNTRTTTPTTVPGIPKPPSDISPSLKAYLEAVSEALEIRLGRRGDPRDRAITLRELINSGLAQDLRTRPFNPNANNSNTLDFLSPDADLAIPPQPTGFSATGGYSLIQLYWDFPRYGNHSQTEIWRYDSDSIGDAQLVGVSPGLAYVDAVGEGKDYYYWIRHVSTSGVAGPFNATAGTRAQTALDVDLLLETLNGAISASELTSSLASQIDGAGTAADLADLETFVGYLSSYTGDPLRTRISDAESDLTAALSFVGYSSSYTGSNLLTRLNQADTDITALETTVNDGTTGVTATSSAVSALGTRVTATESDISTLSTDVSALQSGLTTANGNISGNSTAISGLTTRMTAAEGSITSSATDITNLQSDVSTAQGDITANGTALTSLTTRVTAAEGTISTHTSDISTLNSSVTNNTSNIAGVTSSVNALTTTVNQHGSDISANSSSITGLGTSVTNLQTSVSGQATAINTLQTTVSSQGGTLSTAVSDISTLNTTVGNNSASIQTQATSINGLNAKYTVKIDNNGAVAGYGLASTANSAGNITSEFIVNADRFAILKNASDTGTPNIPFIVQTTTQTINGVSVPPGVYMADAFIRNGTITNAKIGSAAIDNAKLADASISTAKIQDASIFSAKIANGEITNAKIANAAITSAKIQNAAITTAKIGTAQVDTLQLAGESVIVPVADTYSGYIAASWPTFRTSANGLPSATISLSLTTEVLVLWGVRFQGQASGAGNMIIEVYEGGTRILNIGNTTSSPNAVSVGGFVGGAIRRSKTAGTYTYSMRWTAYNSPLYEAYIILLGIQR